MALCREYLETQRGKHVDVTRFDRSLTEVSDPQVEKAAARIIPSRFQHDHGTVVMSESIVLGLLVFSSEGNPEMMPEEANTLGGHQLSSKSGNYPHVAKLKGGPP